MEGISVLQVAAICAAVVLSQTSQPATDSTSRVPRILERAILQRTGFKTAAISYRREAKYPRFPRRIENNEVRITESAEYVVERGDDDGIMSHGSDGGPAFGVRNMCLPEENLFDFAARKAWRHRNSDLSFSLKNIDSLTDRHDLRIVGLVPYEKRNTSPQELLNELAGRKGQTITVTPEGDDLVRVTATSAEESPLGRGVMEWVIDKKKGPSIIKTSIWLQKEGKPRAMEAECRTTLAQFDGRWWPERVEIDFPDASGGVRYDFKIAEFDRPDHPQFLDSDFMGIPVGALVYDVTGDIRKPERRCYVGNGKTVPHADWNSVKDRYDLGPLKQFRERMHAMGSGYFPKWWNPDAADLGLEGVSDRPDLWEAYVRRWVMRHTTSHSWVVLEPLTDAQRTAAQAALFDCRGKAAPIRSRCDAEAKPLQAELALLLKRQVAQAASETGSPVAEKDILSTSQPVAAGTGKEQNEIARLRARLADLEHPKEIAAVFETLKTRLDGILTTKQRDPMNGAFEKPVRTIEKLPNGRFRPVPSTERERVLPPID